MTRSLRQWQREAINAVRAEWDSGVTRTAVVAATGLGKSLVIGRLAVDEAHAGGRALLLAHRKELLTQLTATCRELDPAVPVGRVQAERNETRRPITVASVATLRSEKRQAGMPRPSLIVIDECHRAVSPSHLKILAWAGAFDSTRTLGVTATMVRGDHKGLGDVFESVALKRDIKFGISKGLLVPPRGKVVVTEKLDLTAAKISRGDYQDGELGEMVSQSADEIAKAWIEHAENRITVAFAPTVDSARELRDAFLALGVPAEAVTGQTREREAAYERLAAGITRVLVNVFVLVEGWDCPPVSCVLMARPTRLPAVYVQALGRGLRPHQGKTDCLVLDVVGVSRHQRLVTLVDLHETAEYDTAALDELPCEDCGSSPCTCEPDPEPEQGELWRPQVLGYEDVDDLFAESRLSWLFTRGGIRFLPARDRFAVLWPDASGDTYSVGHCATRYTGGQWLAEHLPLQAAFDVAETWAVDYDSSLVSRDARWRKRRNHSEKQLEYARRLGVRAPEKLTVGQVSDEISIALASRQLDGIR